MGKRLDNVTIVTGLYYIARDKWKRSGFGLGNDRYKWWLPNILSLNTDLVFFTDDHYYEYVQEIADKFKNENTKLTIIKKPLSDLEVYKKYYTDIAILMNSPKFKRIVRSTHAAELLYPLYNTIMYNKVNFLKEAAEIDPYGSDYFFWADLGAFRKEIEHYQNIDWPINAKFFTDKINFFSHAGWNYNIDNQQNYFTSQSRVIHGGYFIVPKDKINFFKNKVDEVIEEILSNGYIGSDEKIFDLICKRDPSNFELTKADWFEFYKMTL